MEESDEAIADKVQKGDTEAFGTLVDRYAAKLSRYGRKFLADQEDIADLVQDVFISAYVNIKSFNIRRSFSPWIYRIAHNAFINALKRKKRDPLPFFDPDTLFPHPVAQETADQGIADSELRETLERSLARLDVKYREPLVLYYSEEMSYREIADILHIPVSTVGIRLKRGKEILQKLYGKR